MPQFCIVLKYDNMETTILDTATTSNMFGYAIGAILAICILAFLVYTLVKPEEF